MLDEKLLVFVLGAPGAGKGTQCDLIVKEYGWAHFSAGDLLRAQVKAGTEMGKQAEEYLKAGTMVPASMIIGLLKQAVIETQHTKVLIDGFPRVLDQLKEFEHLVRPCDTALFYNVPEEAAKERLLKRGQTSGRVDDNEETIHNRFIVFKQESMPVITELEREGRVVEINAAQTPEQVFEATRKVIEQLEQKQASRAQQQLDSAAATTAGAAAATVAVAAGAQAVAFPAASAVSPEASVTLAAVSPVPATTAAEGSSALVSPHKAAAVISPTAAQAADTEVAPAAAGAAGLAAESAISSPTKATVGSPVAASGGAAAGAADGAADAGGVPALAALAKAAAAAGTAAAAASSNTAQAEASAPAATAAGLSEKAVPTIVVPAAVAGVPSELDVTSPTAASPSPRATLSSLHVDLSGIRTPIVICGPSGVGKGTLINKLMEQHPERFGFSVSHTTRGPRPGEVHGKHYYFTEREAMAAQVAAGMFLEHADVHGNMYGTSLAAVAQVSAAGKHTVLDIDVQGAAQVRKSALGPHCLFIFVAPPSHDELERRLRNRGTETEDKVLQRLANAESEIAKAQEPGLFHHVLVNADLEVAYQELQKLIEQRVPGLLHDSQPAVAAGSKHASQAGSAVACAPTAAATLQNASVPAVSPPAAAAGYTRVAEWAAAAAAATAALSPRLQQQHSTLANGNASSAVGGTSTLLDFGFGSSAGPAVAAKGMPVRQYMDATVIPVLRDGLKALNAARPDDPLQFLADYLVSHKAAAA